MTTSVPAALAVRVTPAGHLVVEAASAADAADGLPSAASRARLARAAERGAGHAVLELGVAHAHTPLAPALAFVRDLGARFVARLCAEPELEKRRAKAVPAAPAESDLEALARAVPPLPGAEYVGAAALAAWWTEAAAAFGEVIGEHDGTVEAWLRAHGSAWHVVGKVCFHLAENKADPELPFAFLATYTVGTRADGKPRHAPLSHALAESSARGDRATLLSLLVPVARAAESSALVKSLLDDGDLYHPLAWTPTEAYEFLREIPALEAAGVVVRVPDWWRARRPPRPQVAVKLGGKPPGAGSLGADALVDFDVGVTLDGDALTAEELKALMAQQSGLALVRGKWVELDRERLDAVLAHWKTVEKRARREGLSFLEGMRLIAGAPIDGEAPSEVTDEEAAGWSRVDAGPWLAETLAKLRAPEGLAGADADPGPALHATLRPYQKTGVGWLRFATRLRLGVCLADDMGLGKTIQVLALLLLEKREAARAPAGTRPPPHLLVVPASLLGNWQAEAARFAPSLRLLVAHPSAMPARELAARAETLDQDPVDLVITTYAQLVRQPWLAARAWSLVILDEAQAIKNPGARQTRAVKALRARSRIALTGTPVENRLGDLWSLFDFLDPGLLGTAKQFTSFSKALAARPSEPYAPLRRLVQPYLLRRLKTDKRVIADLPDKTEVKAYCGLARAQAALYQRSVEDLAAELRLQKQGLARRGLVLAYLTRFKQICNHPSHWLKDGAWAEADSGKLARLRELGEDIASRQEKLLVFTQFREACAPLAGFLAEVFGRPGLVLTGDTQVKARTALVREFQDDARAPFFVLSLKAGGTGLNLTAASHVVHFDRWWNPAVENQATDRAFRIGQQRNVMVHKMICRGTIEERIDALLDEKRGLAESLMGGAGGAEKLLTELADDELLSLVALDVTRAAVD